MKEIKSRKEVITALHAAATEGMMTIKDSTENEVISAIMFTAYSTMLVVGERGGNMESFRDILGMMVALLPPSMPNAVSPSTRIH